MTNTNPLANPFRVGSMLWIERNTSNAYRELLESVFDGTMTVEEAREAVKVQDSDSVSF